MNNIEQKITERRARNRYRRREVLDSAQGTHVTIDNIEYLSFSSNDYLGLANHQDVIRASNDALNKYGTGSGAAHLITGHGRLHHQLEEALAEYIGCDRALLFSTGYMANVAVITALCEKGDVVVQDRWNHASLIDGGRFCDAKMRRYQHVDMVGLERALSHDHENFRLIATDGVFSMDGDIAPLPEILALAEQKDAMVLLDDAHGLGVLGKNGRGCSDYFGIDSNPRLITMGTLGKAFGSFGAFVAGSSTLIDWLIQQARMYVYTTALPPAVAAAALASLHIIQTQPQRREQLQLLIKTFRQRALEMGLTLMPSETPIQPIILGSETVALKWSEALKSQSILVKAIRPPTVPEGTSRLRVTFSADHSVSDVEHLLDELEVLAAAT